MKTHKQLLVGQVKATDTDDPNGSFEVILSAPTLDRDGEVIDAKAFDPLPEHITFDIDHGLSTATTVGSGTPRYDGDLLKVTGTFSSIPRAQEVRTLVEEGHIRTTSVAFMAPKRQVKDGVPHIVKAELLNGAFVPVPSNREAVVLAAKSLDGALLEADTKALAGSYEERREQLRTTIADANPEAWWVHVIATFDDSVIYEVDGRDGTVCYQATYSLSDDGLTLDEGVEVDIVEVVQPKAAEKSTTVPEDAAAEAANPPVNGMATAKAAVIAAEAEAGLVLSSHPTRTPSQEDTP